MRPTTPSELDQVQRDLSTLREAAGIGLPFGKEVVRFWLVIAASSAVVALAFAFGSATYRIAGLGLFATVGAVLPFNSLGPMTTVFEEEGDRARVTFLYGQLIQKNPIARAIVNFASLFLKHSLTRTLTKEVEEYFLMLRAHAEDEEAASSTPDAARGA